MSEIRTQAYIDEGRFNSPSVGTSFGIGGNIAKSNDFLKSLLLPSLSSSDGRVVKAYASVTVDSGLIPSRVKPMTLKLLFTTSLLDA